MKSFVGLALFASPALAVDGVVEINHTAIAQGGITASDSPGYPATLDRAGSYRLTGNLSPPTGQHGVEIVADDVSLDLNGFRIKGPSIVICPIGGCPPDNGVGVYGPNRQGLTVQNGTIVDMGSAGIEIGPRSRVEDIIARSNGAEGIVVGYGSVIQQNVASDNQTYGIRSGPGTVVLGNSMHGNRAEGLLCTVVNGRACGYAENVLRQNNQSTDPNDQVYGADPMGGNLCENVLCL